VPPARGRAGKSSDSKTHRAVAHAERPASPSTPNSATTAKPRRGGEADAAVRRAAVVAWNAYRRELSYRKNLWRADERQESLPLWDNHLPPASADLWLGLGRRLLARGIEPHAFVKRVVAHTTIVKPAPLPADLAGPAAMSKYEAATRAALDDARIACDYCISQFQNRVRVFGKGKSPESAYTYEILSEDEYPPLFLYCAAVAASITFNSAKLARIAEDLFLDAMAQYCRDPDAYDKTWARVLPTGFRERALETFSQI
jgi:hypothetical protein